MRAPVPWNRETQRALKLEAAGDGAYGAIPATFLQRPRFASRLAKVAGAVGALAVLVGAILGAAVISNNVQPPWADPSPVATAPPGADAGRRYAGGRRDLRSGRAVRAIGRGVHAGRRRRRRARHPRAAGSARSTSRSPDPAR